MLNNDIVRIVDDINPPIDERLGFNFINKKPEMISYPPEVVLRQVEHFLRCACALDGCIWEGEDGVSLLEGLHGGECLLHVLRVVVGADSWVVL